MVTLSIFQSTPPARGATTSDRHFLVTITISIHAPREGGDVMLLSQFYTLTDISIHAPREGGDVCYRYTTPQYLISIHAPREGGDDTWLLCCARIQHFNPRPPRGGRQQRCTVLPADL